MTRWFWQKVSGGVNRGDDHPHTATTPWQAGVVSAVTDVRVSVRPSPGGRRATRAPISHVKPRNPDQAAPTEVPEEGDVEAAGA